MNEPKIVVTLEGEQRTSGITGFISWERLAETFWRIGETCWPERLVQFEADKYGITFIVEKP